MEAYGKILLIAMPIFLLLVLLEKWYGWRKGEDTVEMMDMVSSLTSGVTNVTKDVLGLSVAVISYGWFLKSFAIIHIEEGILVYVIAFLAMDFSGYCIHRIQHSVNIFWNAHAIHHSSEEFNLACALRQSASSFFKIFVFFLIPAAILGVPSQVISVVAPLHLFIQFWYHTRHIGKMGFLENIIVTPSHHRVHHAINPEYLDKNYAQVFIFWDKLFGTFQEEKKDIVPVYGITRPAATWNPIKINFQHLFLLVSDALRTKSWVDKFRVWFMPTGWRPSDVEAKYPVNKINDVYNFEKYNPKSSLVLKTWSFIQMLFLLFFVSYLFGNISQIGVPGIFYYGLFIFLFIYSLTDLMDRSSTAFVWEGMKTILGFCFFYMRDEWLGEKIVSPLLFSFVGGYLIVSLLISIHFSIKHKKEDSLQFSLS
jgi:sterol desaturase/sphingolipid hydroxylase (fatty acid hydroxylase superfamily)